MPKQTTAVYILCLPLEGTLSLSKNRHVLPGDA